MNTRKMIILLSLATGVVGLLSFLGARRGSVKSQELSPTAFTATIVDNQYDSRGKQVYSEYILDAVRSDGSEVRIFRRQLPDSEWFEPKWVLDLGDAKRVSVDPSTQSLLTYQLPDATVTAYRSRAAECSPLAQAADAARSTMFGMPVVRVTQDTPTGSNTVMHEERWLAPQLGCFPLREVFTVGYGPPNAAHKSVREVIFLTEGEPAASLFTIPSGYTERSPSQFAAEFARRFPGHAAMSDQSAATLDRIYQAAQPK